MKVYVICPKKSSDEEIVQEFIEGYGLGDLSMYHVRHIGISYESVNNRYSIMSDSAKDFLEIRTIELLIKH